MLSERILVDHDGKYWLGEVGERRYGRMNFSELYAVFSVQRVIRAFHHQSEIGSIGAEFVEAFDAGKQGTPAFMLGGRARAMQHVDWQKGVCTVLPAPAGKAPRWQGPPCSSTTTCARPGGPCSSATPWSQNGPNERGPR